ncbi:MFS transporter [Sphaerisporangium krabiense]|uniref:Putative MFS family arabinose efflux permease n=1 Tax=Sphaerisporangium krabiense TaxID=763782 RepID=A0A7W8ZC22_9ACTN|nr:MFS transporter [Sphaerisporangium krabiense]MBB5631272.1 putative MFS family arabinose efflux permease [Sphaerisporangium krabiense]GII61115.1 MFS transporter [Sphaerisporangium krabiense]
MDSRALRRARVAVAMTFAVHGAVSGSFATRIPWIQDHVQAGPGELGLALLAPAVGSLIAMPMAGRVIHRFGNRPATRVLLALWSVMLALPAVAPDLGVLWVTLLVFGASAGMCDVGMNEQGVVVEQRMGRSIMSGLHGMWSVGGLAGGAAGTLAAHFGVDARIHLGVTAAVLLAVGLVIGRHLLDVRPRDDQEAPAHFVLPSRSVLLLGLIGFCAVFGEGAGADWSAVYLRDVAGASPGLAAMSYTAFALTMAVGRLSGDMVVRRLGAVVTVRISGLLAALGGVLVVLARSPVPAVAGFMLIGLGVAVVVPLAFAAAGNAARTPSEGVAGVATLSYSSGFIAPSAIGGIAAQTSLPVSFGVVTVLMVAVLLLAGTLGRRRAPVESASTPVS